MFLFNVFPFDQLRVLRDELVFKKNDLKKSYLELIKKFTLRFAPILSIALLLLFLIPTLLKAKKLIKIT